MSCIALNNQIPTNYKKREPASEMREAGGRKKIRQGNELGEGDVGGDCVLPIKRVVTFWPYLVSNDYIIAMNFDILAVWCIYFVYCKLKLLKGILYI